MERPFSVAACAVATLLTGCLALSCTSTPYDEYRASHPDWEPFYDPKKGLLPEEVVASIYAPPREKYALTVRGLNAFTLLEGELAEAPLEVAGAQGDEDQLAVVAVVYCRSLNQEASSSAFRTSWFLFRGGELSAWDYFRFGSFCTIWNDFEPATGDLVGLEKAVEARLDEAGGHRYVHRRQLYQKGLELVRVGRVEDAKLVLKRADETLDHDRGMASGRHPGRTDIATWADRDAMRERLVTAIEAVERSGSPPGE